MFSRGDSIPPMDPPGERDPLLLLRPLRAAVAAARSNKLSGRIPVETLSVAAAALLTSDVVPSPVGDDKTSKDDDDEQVSTPSTLPFPPSYRDAEDDSVKDSKVESRVEILSKAFLDGAPSANTESRRASLSGRVNIEGKRGSGRGGKASPEDSGPGKGQVDGDDTSLED